MIALVDHIAEKEKQSGRRISKHSDTNNCACAAVSVSGRLQSSQESHRAGLLAGPVQIGGVAEEDLGSLHDRLGKGGMGVDAQRDTLRRQQYVDTSARS
jgi:hypothetical protein